MSSRPKNPKYARNKNILVIGGSGSGKTRFFVKPVPACRCTAAMWSPIPKDSFCPEVGTHAGARRRPQAGRERKAYTGRRTERSSMSRTASRSSTPSTFKKSMKYNPLRLHSQRKGYFKAGQCHHRQHQRRRGKILRRFLGEGRTAFVLRPDRLHLVRGGAGGERTSSRCWSSSTPAEAREDDEELSKPRGYPL